MESNDTKITRKEIIQIVFNILLAITIAALIFTTITLIKKSEEIKNDPIDYAIKNSNIESCICFNDEGQSHNYGLNKEETFQGELGDIKIGDLQLVKEK